ncbi:hypothetical protein [Wolbachia endosymbiont (group A) of Anomoia purmunda]|uniref:hypothetical protein n=1 Tax=Wolbachia endosymbiont (group A) of Anomoia purmunda TaxID=2953978 RepID=UPI00223246ED|nr:hypothetical protein [Wolbachia endosymbiont (group A) of Anomoia purmunda]
MLDTGISFHSIIAVLLSCHPSSLFFVIPVLDTGMTKKEHWDDTLLVETLL